MFRSLSTGSLNEALRKNTVQLTESAPLMAPPITTAPSFAQPPAQNGVAPNAANASATPAYPVPPTGVVIKDISRKPIPCGKPSNLIGSACATGCGVGGGVIGYLCCGLWGLFGIAGGAALGGYCGKETTKSCDPLKGKPAYMRTYR